MVVLIKEVALHRVRRRMRRQVHAHGVRLTAVEFKRAGVAE